MGFEIHESNDRVPDEEDVYGVNDIEEEEAFNKLLGVGSLTQEERLRRRHAIMVWVSLLLLAVFGLTGAILMLLKIFSR